MTPAGRPPCWRDSSLSMRSRSRSGWKARVRNPASSRLHPKRTKPLDDVPHPHPARDTSPQALAALQSANLQTLNAMVKELDPQAHFVSYAAPSFVAFRRSIFLELSINTTLNDPSAGSRYRMAALAFDEHVAHLIRPVLGYFKPDPKQDPQFDGI